MNIILPVLVDMDLEVAYSFSVCRFILEPGIFFKNGSLRCTHYCKKPLFSNGRCIEHISPKRQLWPASITEEQLEKYPTEWNAFMTMRRNGIAVVSDNNDEFLGVPEADVDDHIHLRHAWHEICENVSALEWLRNL